MSQTVHAGCVARLTPSGWAGAVIRGPSGVGKSDLALRLLEGGWVLVGDDRLHLWASKGRVFARGAPALAGLIEARGLGVLFVPRRPITEVRLLVDCLPPTAEFDRIPEKSFEAVAGVRLNRLQLRPLEAAAPAKVRHALEGSAATGGPF